MKQHKEPIGNCEVCEQKVYDKTESKKDFGYASVICRLCEKKFPDLKISLNKKGDLLLTWTQDEIRHCKLIPVNQRNGITKPIVEPLQAWVI